MSNSLACRWTGAACAYSSPTPREPGYHLADLAHSTHLRGAGSYDAATGERLRVTVTLATAIPENVVRSVNLDYLDPGSVDIEAWSADPDTLVVPDAGERLYRLG